MQREPAHGETVTMKRLILPILLLATPARAETLHYVAYALGLPAADVSMTLDPTDRSYRIAFAVRTLGVADVVAHASIHSEATGLWAPSNYGRDTLPGHYEAHGRYRGVNRDTVIDYAGDVPLPKTLLPADDEPREPIPPELRARTTDGISAIAGLLHHAERTGRCDEAVRTYDGRRLSDTALHTVGTETLEPNDRSSFAGPALRCDFEGRLLAGFVIGENRARAARPLHGSVWVATVDGHLVPVRIAFETRGFGDAVAYLSPPVAGATAVP